MNPSIQQRIGFEQLMPSFVRMGFMHATCWHKGDASINPVTACAPGRSYGHEAATRHVCPNRVLGKDGHELLSRVHAKLLEHGIETPSVQVLLQVRG